MRQHTETHNAADARATRKAGRRAERRLADFEDAVRAVLATPAGRRLFGDLEHGLLSRFGLYRTTFAPDHAIYFNAGMHHCALDLLALVQRVSPEAWLLMEREARQLERRADAEAEAAAIDASREESDSDSAVE